MVTNSEWRKLNSNSHVSKNPLQPTIDHIIPIAYGYLKNISYKVIGGYDNLCICSRDYNVRKNGKFMRKQYVVNNTIN